MNALILLAFGCPRSTPPPPPEPEPVVAVPEPVVVAPEPVEAPASIIEITSGADLRTAMGKRVRVTGVPERHAYPTGGEGTALMLDGGAKLWVSDSEPPEGFAEVIGNRVTVEGLLKQGPVAHGERILIPYLYETSPPHPADAPL